MPQITAVDQLESRLGATWPNIKQARTNANSKLDELNTVLPNLLARDTSIVLFGSLGRLELTSGSDIDWTMLLDGSSDPRHFEIALEIAEIIDKVSGKAVGQERTFGSLVSSHDLINYIGGEGDTNSNMTRRNLLLLESRSIGDPGAYERVKKNLLQRYISEDHGLWRSTTSLRLPHFLLNDLARYWRTMTVDYAYKQRARGGKGIPLRNIKLRMSRKLIYIAGLLACFDCHVGFTKQERDWFYADRKVPALVARMNKTLMSTPLEIVAGTFLQFPELDEFANAFFTAYDQFLGLLLSEASRTHLEKLNSDEAEQDPLYLDAKQIAHRFRDAVEAIFLTDKTELGRLTIKYGVF